MKLILVLFAVSLLVSLSSGKVPSLYSRMRPKPASNPFSNLATLPTHEQIRLKVQSLLAPGRFPEALLSELREVPEYWPFYLADFVNVEIRQWLLQSKKFGPDVHFPEYKYSYSNDYCWWLWCVKEDVSYRSGGTRVSGSETITSESKITPNQFTNMFHVGSFNWTSPDYLLNVTDYLAAEISYWKGSFLSMEGSSVGFQFNYGPVEGLGIQISNTTLHFNPGTIRLANYVYEEYDFYGNLLRSEPGDPEEGIFVEDWLREPWFYVKREYTEGMQWGINCLLSHGGSDPDCFENGEGDWDWYERYMFHFMQITQTQLLQLLVLGEIL